MSDPARALGLHFEDDYAPLPRARWRQPWAAPAVRGATALGALVVGFLIAAGLTAGFQAAEATDARKEELIALVHARQERAAALGAQLDQLRQEVAAAEQALRSAGAGTLNTELARLEAATGLTAVQGPGTRVTLSDATGACPTGRPEDCRIQDVDLQLAANTLWAVGAEAVAVNGERIIATTAIRSAGSAVLINYRVLTSPYVVEAIGAPDQMTDAFSGSQLAEDFAVWRDVFGLGFTAEAADELTLPPYTGSVRLRTAVDASGETS